MFIENRHVHVERIVAALTGTAGVIDAMPRSATRIVILLDMS